MQIITESDIPGKQLFLNSHSYLYYTDIQVLSFHVQLLKRDVRIKRKMQQGFPDSLKDILTIQVMKWNRITLGAQSYQKLCGDATAIVFNNRKKNLGFFFSLTFLLPFVMGKWVYKLQIPEMYLDIAGTCTSQKTSHVSGVFHL